MALRLASEAAADSRLPTWMLHGVAGISLLDFILYLYRVLIDSAGCEGRVSSEGANLRGTARRSCRFELCGTRACSQSSNTGELHAEQLDTGAVESSACSVCSYTSDSRPLRLVEQPELDLFLSPPATHLWQPKHRHGDSCEPLSSPPVHLLFPMGKGPYAQVAFRGEAGVVQSTAVGIRSGHIQTPLYRRASQHTVSTYVHRLSVR